MSDSAPPRAFRRRGLGRGLEALLTNEAEAEEGSPLISLDPRTVAPNPEQPRRAFEPDALAALGDSIRLHGLLHPIVVQRDGDSYCLVAGERRLRAAQLAGIASIPAIVRPAAESSRHQLEVALTENLQRTDLNPMEEAAAYARLSDAFGLTHEAIALRLGRSRSGVTNAIRLLDLPAPVQEAVAELEADREPRAGVAGAPRCGGSGGRRCPGDRRRPECARDRTRGPGAAHTGVGACSPACACRRSAAARAR